MPALSSQLVDVENKISIVILVDESRLAVTISNLVGPKILFLGDLENRLLLSEWKDILAGVDKIYLHGRKAFEYFRSPYITVEGAMPKVIYASDLDYAHYIIMDDARELAAKSSMPVQIVLHSKLEIQSRVADIR
jgi:hypothetical protein